MKNEKLNHKGSVPPSNEPIEEQLEDDDLSTFKIKKKDREHRNFGLI